MYPLEFVKLPAKSDIWIMYIDGEHCRNVNKPYIENGTIHFPYDVVCEKLHCTKAIDEEYVDADTLLKYHNVSLTWEKEAQAIYITSTVHYDGYRCFDDVIDNPVNSLEFLGRYCYIDAFVEDITETNVVLKKHKDDLVSIDLKKSNHRSAEGTSNVAINVGGTYRFCFELLSINKNSFCGRLMETADIPNINTQYGFMQYRVQDWKKIEKWIREEETNIKKNVQVYFVLTHLAGMHGVRIACLNIFCEKLVDSIRKISGEQKIGIDISILEYSSGSSWVGDKHTDSKKVIWNAIEAYGLNEFGSALKLLDDELRQFHSDKEEYKPIIIFAQAGMPTDNFVPILEKITENQVFSNALRIVVPFTSADWTDGDVVNSLIGTTGLLISGDEYENDESYSPYNDIDIFAERITKAILIHVKKDSSVNKIDSNQKKIIDMLTRYNASVESAQKLKAFLLDCIPEERAIRNVLVAAYSEGVIEEIKNNQDSIILRNRFVKKMVNNYGFSEQIVIWAFDTWKYYCENEDGICK